MGIKMGALSPHPPIIIPEIGKEEREQVSDTISSLKELAKEIKNLDSDLLITISPHGPVFRDAISVLGNEEVQGDFSDFGHSAISFRKNNHPDFYRALQKKAEKADIELIVLPSKEVKQANYTAELDHGVLVPLFYLEEAGVNIPLAALTMGLLPYGELYDFGRLIRETVEELKIDAVLLASGDLSHRLKPGAPAGFNPRGKEFDNKLVELIEEKRFDEVMDIDPSLIKKAGECGLRPLLMMLGAFRDIEVDTEVKSYEGPFGVGYAVAGIYPGEG
ncbi:MAG: class III extradiol dioxygenase subunit B-like domain-containing protein [Halanaerobiales bacterium]